MVTFPKIPLYSTMKVLALLVAFAEVMSCVSFEEDMRLTGAEKRALDKFKQQVVPKIPKSSYLQKYVNDDLYFVRWVRAKNLDVQGAEKMFMDHLAWRKAEKIDNIDKEDWSMFEKEYPIFTDGVDKEGRPLSELWFSDWNVRQGVLAGKSKALTRWLAHMFETQSRQLYEARASGKNVSQVVMLVEIEGFNLIQQGCPGCLPIYLSITRMYESHYPNIFESYYLLNMPPSFDIILRVVIPVMSKPTRDAMKIMPNREEWIKVLDQKIEKDQRSIRFKGTKERSTS